MIFEINDQCSIHQSALRPTNHISDLTSSVLTKMEFKEEFRHFAFKRYENGQFVHQSLARLTMSF